LSITVRTLTQMPELALSCVAGRRGLDATVRWVHVSEIPDPTPWLQGGEFLITTGLHLTDEAVMADYVRKLSAVGVAGIGFGTGLTHAQVPAAVCEAAEVCGIPVVEVPLTTPYVAISETVSRRLAAEEYETIQRAFEVQRRLTTAALEHEGTPGVLALLAKTVQGWCVVTNVAGRALAAHPVEAGRRVGEFAADLERIRAQGLNASVSVVQDSGCVLIQPLGVRGRIRRLLLVGKTGPFTPFDRMVVSGAVTLLSLEAEQEATVTESQRLLREQLVSRVLHDDATTRERTDGLTRLGLSTQLRVARVHLPAPGTPLGPLVEEYFHPHDLACVTVVAAEGPALTATAVVEDAGPVTVERFRALAEGELRRGIRVGLGRPVTADRLPLGHRQAQLALEAARRYEPGITVFDELPLHELVLGLAPLPALRTITDTLVGPLEGLDETGRGQLVHTLTVFLEAHGRWEQAAARLGVHRHTLHNRISRIERELSVNLESMDVRAGLWFALAARRTMT
jgi:purine catabolism regulator